jgi:BirA family biotin operon repressor/biotin-[acetyl-CoA-carboxylase] ligase
VLGIGLNVAVDPAELPEELRDRAGTLGRSPADVEPALAELLTALQRRLAEPAEATVAELRRRDALDGAAVAWAGGEGVGGGIDGDGRLLVRGDDGSTRALGAGEVHLLAAPAPRELPEAL